MSTRKRICIGLSLLFLAGLLGLSVGLDAVHGGPTFNGKSLLALVLGFAGWYEISDALDIAQHNEAVELQEFRRREALGQWEVDPHGNQSDGHGGQLAA
ncbi:hypothetical protein ACIP5Z_02250 [Rothia terrae]|uniref:hypothetical protein n=1 Tax=Rothia terrae TaxID=396015 RepID=UPI003827462D